MRQSTIAEDVSITDVVYSTTQSAVTVLRYRKSDYSEANNTQSWNI